MPLRVVLDTNIFVRDMARRTQDFITLRRLCEQGLVHLLVPDIVKREFETQLDQRAKEHALQFRSAAGRLLGGPSPAQVRHAVQIAVNAFDAQREAVESSFRVSFRNWLLTCGATVLPLRFAAISASIDDYFAGSRPYRSIKSREDIPDGIVLRTIERATETGELMFVSEDNRMRAAVAQLAGVTVFQDLAVFIASEPVQQSISQMHHAQAQNVLRLLAELPATARENPLLEFVIQYGAASQSGSYFQSRSVPSDDKQAYLLGFSELRDVRLDWRDAAFHGDNVFTVPFKATGNFDISYYIPRYETDKALRRGARVADYDQYQAEATEEADLRLGGTLKFNFAIDFDPDDEVADAITDISFDAQEEPVLLEDLPTLALAPRLPTPPGRPLRPPLPRLR